MAMFKNKSGFTIVELLIVIVVIGILATIVIVAYNGVQDRARATAASSALTQASKKLAIYQVDNGGYPSTLSAAGVTNTNDVTYQYRTTSSGYCVTATSGTISYKVTETTPPSQGGCTLANLGANPSLETNLVNWGPTWAGATLTRVTSGTGIISGSAALEVIVNTPNASGTNYTVPGLTASTPYTASGYITLVSGDPAGLMILTSDGAGTRASSIISPALSVGETRRLNLSWTSSTSPATSSVSIMRNGTSSGSAVIRLDAFMIDQGSSVNTYADGNSAGWTWTGTANNSTSTGPPL
ncbi:MAG: hypothetical protein JWO61_156 [Candidatus Saccharibacteria bacterium]|nr:hypothetical protein [Candidatus Saccharibacteria bacterium]